MAVAPYDRIFKLGESRLFSTIRLAVLLTDSLVITSLAILEKLDFNVENPTMKFDCESFPLGIHLPIIHPMKTVIQNRPVVAITLNVCERTEQPSGGHTIDAFWALQVDLFSMVFAGFYEQELPYIRENFGGDTKRWPQVFQFAWLVRNSIVHHNGDINFQNLSFPPVSWHAFAYSPADNGKPIFGPHFAPGDLLMLLFDVSDELDNLGAPLQPY
ncbi:MAG TPA: hypothetical protein VGO49_22650 [Bradyrhizobium sp.]|jgi:hypothetical protein|nr:hypothetical protein [Bradyrhizobium sp.]